MKHYPPTLSRTLELIERRRLYTLHMSNLNPPHGGTNNSPFDPIPAVVHRDGKKKYYREFELQLRKGEHARIKRPPSNKNRSSYSYKRSANLSSTASNIDNNTINRYVSKKSLNDTQKSNTESNDNTTNDDEENLNETTDHIIERLVQESGMRVVDRARAPRTPNTSPRKNRTANYTMSSTTSRPSNYVNNQTQTLKRNQTLNPHPPEDIDNEASPRKSRASSHKSEHDDNFDENDNKKEEEESKEENKNEEEENKENDENKGEEEEKEENDENKGEEEEKDENKNEEEENKENDENKGEEEDKKENDENKEEEEKKEDDDKEENDEDKEKNENDE